MLIGHDEKDIWFIGIHALGERMNLREIFNYWGMGEFIYSELLVLGFSNFSLGVLF